MWVNVSHAEVYLGLHRPLYVPRLHGRRFDPRQVVCAPIGDAIITAQKGVSRRVRKPFHRWDTSTIPQNI